MIETLVTRNFRFAAVLGAIKVGFRSMVVYVSKDLSDDQNYEGLTLKSGWRSG